MSGLTLTDLPDTVPDVDLSGEIFGGPSDD